MFYEGRERIVFSSSRSELSGFGELDKSRSWREIRHEMTLRLKSVGPVAVLQKYQQILRCYYTNQTGERSHDTKREISASASAYEVLGLPEKCSAASIRMAFRKLAKATHPDLQSDYSAVEFVRVLAAYEILSDPEKRAKYDENLRANRAEQSRINASAFQGASHGCSNGGHGQRAWEEQELGYMSGEVVSWLHSYRVAVRDIIRRQEIGVGRGWEEDLRAETQSALRKAYFGPPVSERHGLPDCFEAEERAQPDLLDVLHLVSGRQLFGLVHQVNVPLLEGRIHETTSLLHTHADALESNSNKKDPVQIVSERELHTDATQSSRQTDSTPGSCPTEEDLESAFVELELQLFGNVVARSVRVPSTESSSGRSASGNDDQEEDCIYVYLSPDQVEDYDSETDSTNELLQRIFLGSIRGLGSSKGGSVCNVYGPDGNRTHLILQHRTPGVKHMQWFRVGKDGSPCECRCRRASVLPSRYWIFEPRTDTHNVGGWYIETFGNRRRPFRRRVNNRGSGPPEGLDELGMPMDCVGMGEGKMLHPAMYILAAAYKTLDEEAAQRRKGSVSARLKTWSGLDKISSGFSVWWRSRWSLWVWP